MVYAYIYLQEEKLTEIEVQLTYYQTTEQLITRVRRHFTVEELTEFYTHLINEYHKWLVFQENWRRVRNTSLQLLKFPFETYRKGQRELAAAAYKTLKTASDCLLKRQQVLEKPYRLFSCTKSIRRRDGDRLFYLTAKRSLAK